MPRPPLLRRLRHGVRRVLLSLLLLLVLVPLAAILLARHVDPPLTALMAIRWFAGQRIDYRPAPLEAVAPSLRFAVIAAEDNLFCSHAGLDWQALRQQIERWWQGERPRGASTITMQTAKNLLLWPGRDLARKLAEVPLTLLIEATWPKRRILEVYLEIVEFGPGIFGAEAAAQYWYGKPARALSRREAALLAAILPAPLEWRPRPPSPGVARRAAVIERRIGQLGPLLDCAR